MKLAVLDTNILVHYLKKSMLVQEIQSYLLDNELLMAYATIDAYCQGKIPSPNGQLLNNSSRNMGKNDLWIAATAYAINALLLTTDGDYDHLDKSFINLKKYAL